jgi:pilus assembly protein FimV
MFTMRPTFLIKFLCLISLSWASTVFAITLGSPQLLSKPNEPLKVEIPIRLASDEQVDLTSMQVSLPSSAAYERLGVSSRLLNFNPQVILYRNQSERLFVLLETVIPVSQSEDPFLDVLLTLKWDSGSITKAYTLLIGDAQKLVVRQGQTLSKIAEQIAPQFDGATLDQTMLALFKINPDAFASGSINRLLAGAALNRPSEALIRSISPAEAKQFVAEAYAQFNADQVDTSSNSANERAPKNGAQVPAKDLLKIGSSIDENVDKRLKTEELVAQEEALEQTRAKIVELEKNITDLQLLLDASKARVVAQSSMEQFTIFGVHTPTLLALGLVLFAAIVLWLLSRNARKNEVPSPVHSSRHSGSSASTNHAQSEIPERAKALLDGIDLDLSPKKSSGETQSSLADTLRVKLNLARAYITIEDFTAATKSLEEIMLVSSSVDPAMTIEAKELLVEIALRQS